jgi:hypothetical protein
MSPASRNAQSQSTCGERLGIASSASRYVIRSWPNFVMCPREIIGVAASPTS